VPTADDLAADQAAVDLAQINVQIARQNLAAATLTSPLTGTVASVSGNSTTAVVTILSPGSYLVSATVPLSVIDKIEVGQDTQVRPDVLSQTLDGTVATIGVLTSSTSTSSSATFPITVAVRSPDATLYDGSGAAVTIRVGQVDGVLTVPSSAVHTDGSR
jgi:multidrug resistance efflux pump